MHKKLYLIVFLCFQIYIGSTQILIPKKDYKPEARHPRYSFSISLITGANSEPVSYGIYRQNPDSTFEVIFLTKSAFLRQVMGHESSRANPNKINYFEEFGIDPKVLDLLWKLKHDAFPYEKNDDSGWGTSIGVPTKAQFGMLNEFGIYRVSDCCYGENLWRFLLKVNDPIWQAHYQQLR